MYRRVCDWWYSTKAMWRWRFYRRMYFIKEFLATMGIPLKKKYYWHDIIDLGLKALAPCNQPNYNPNKYRELMKEYKRLKARNEKLEEILSEVQWWVSRQ